MVVWMDKTSNLFEPLTAHLQKATGWRVHQEESPRGVMDLVGKWKGEVRVVILTSGCQPNPIIQLIREIRSLAESCAFECPRILVLSLNSQPPSVIAEFEDLGVEYLLRKFTEQIVERVRALQWHSKSKKGLPTLIVRRRDGHVAAILLEGLKEPEELRIGPRLRSRVEDMAVHRRTAHSTDSLADALGICRQSVKEYLFRLRQSFDWIRMRACVSTLGSKVFWTERQPGGYVHGLHANVKFDDGTDGVAGASQDWPSTELPTLV